MNPPEPPRIFTLHSGRRIVQYDVVSWSAVEGAWFATSLDGSVGCYPFRHHKNLRMVPQ